MDEEQPADIQEPASADPGSDPGDSPDGRTHNKQRNDIMRAHKLYSEEYDNGQAIKTRKALAHNRVFIDREVASLDTDRTIRSCAVTSVLAKDHTRKVLAQRLDENSRRDLIDGYLADQKSTHTYNTAEHCPSNEVVTVKLGTEKERLAARIMAEAEDIPKYTAWTYLRQNENAPDVGVCMFYTDEAGETVPAPMDGAAPPSDSTDMTDLNELQRGNTCFEGGVAQAKIRSGRNEPKENYIIKRLLERYGKTGDVVDALSSCMKMPAQLVESRVQEVQWDMATSVARPTKEREENGLASCMDVFHRLFCRRCKIFMCQKHRSLRNNQWDCGNVHPHDIPPKSVPSLKNSAPCDNQCWKPHDRNGKGTCNEVDLLVSGTNTPPELRHHEGQGAHSIGDSNGANVLTERLSLDDQPNSRAALERRNNMSPGGGDPGGHPRPESHWTNLEKDLLNRGREIFADDSCRIARLVGTRTCQEVNTILNSEPLLELTKAPATHKRAPARRKRASARRIPKAAKNAMMKIRANHDPLRSWPQYEPCECHGQCDVNCPCVQRGTGCEKFCGCSPQCQVRFGGCKCKGSCNTKRCPCRMAGRDCSPDKCRCCGAARDSNGRIKPDGMARCQNMCFSCRDHKRVAMGISNIAGWGAFLMEPVAKGDFLGEYTGDLITDQEAERRGKVYDKEQHSYLFDLNDRKVLDAKRRGNKLRFANHSASPNCFVRHHVVDGDHRIGIYAACNMQAGEELLYDYQYYKILGDRAPAWAVDPKPTNRFGSAAHESNNHSSLDVDGLQCANSSQPGSSADHSSMQAAASALQSLSTLPHKKKTDKGLRGSESWRDAEYEADVVDHGSFEWSGQNSDGDDMEAEYED